ncbi:hypothetical protein [Actinoplanes sp. NPDC026670]|uniref:hypothetical protein n=1 Tax=Actinoplanes sp. NPDC026670 TaxID=3154700 RepID=UPI00340D525E
MTRIATTGSRTVDPACLETAGILTSLATHTETVAGTVTGGPARRMSKLSRQMHAAAGLLRNGWGLPAPAGITAVKYLTEVGAGFTAQDVDAQVYRLQALIVRLHDWRGHTGCLSAGARH